jgi:hypothetical protein
MRLQPLMLCLASLLVLTACPRSYVDDDHEASMARQVILDMEVRDSLNPKGGDQTDWKRVVPMADGKVTLTVVVGDPFVGSHNVVGAITVFDSDKEVVAKARLDSMQNEYKLRWLAVAQSAYWVRFKAHSGDATYSINYAPKRVNPCDKCSSSERCERGMCLPREVVPCNGPCPRGKVCDSRTNECTSRNPCSGVTCKSGKVCRGGVCRTKSVRPAGCNPPCSSKERCKGTRCVAKKKPVAEGPRVVKYNAKVVSRSGQGDTSYLVLNKGSAHGVKVGDTGSIGGFGLRVVNVYAVRCKVRVKASLGKLAGKNSAVIKTTR